MVEARVIEAVEERLVETVVARSIGAVEAYLVEAVVARLVEARRIEVAEQYCCSDDLRGFSMDCLCAGFGSSRLTGLGVAGRASI